MLKCYVKIGYSAIMEFRKICLEKHEPGYISQCNKFVNSGIKVDFVAYIPFMYWRRIYLCIMEGYVTCKIKKFPVQTKQIWIRYISWIILKTTIDNNSLESANVTKLWQMQVVTNMQTQEQVSHLSVIKMMWQFGIKGQYGLRRPWLLRW